MIRQLLNFISIMTLCGVIICSCADENDVTENTDLIEDADFADAISEQLHLYNATRIPGDAPGGPSTHSLKISFKDTLYLNDTLPRAVKFQHLNPEENVSGIYLQVFIGGSGGIINASHHYDVPEQQGTSDSDSISVFLIGLKEHDLPLPFRCRVRMAPHDEDGNVIAEAVKDIVIEELHTIPSINNGECPLVLPPEQSWYWDLTLSYAGGVFDYFPGSTFGKMGQEIQGCCIEGESDSGPTCLTADPETRRTLHFATSYQIISETFKFFDDGTFVRTTMENTTNPAPAESNFCASAPGVVKDFVGLKTYHGKWEVIHAPEFNNDTERLTFADITSTGTGAGFGNRGGYIHQLDCRLSPPALVIIDPNPEGNPFAYTLKSYAAVEDDRVFARWHPF